MANLLESRCTAQPHAFGEAELRDHLAQLPGGWRVETGALEKQFSFANWLETLAFVNALGWTCHIEDHHPDLAVGYDRCRVRFATHSAGGITVNDFICAAKADALVAFAA